MSGEGADESAVAVAVLGRAAGLERAIARALRGTNLGVAHWMVLVHLVREGGFTMADLAARTNLPPATLTRTVDRLVDHALVQRGLDAHDRRRVLVRTADRGAARLAELAERVDAAVAEALAGLEGWEREALCGLLGRVDVST